MANVLIDTSVRIEPAAVDVTETSGGIALYLRADSINQVRIELPLDEAQALVTQLSTLIARRTHAGAAQVQA